MTCKDCARHMRHIEIQDEVIGKQNAQLREISERFLEQTGNVPPGLVVMVRPPSDLN